MSLTKDDATTHEETRDWAYIEKICSSTDTGVREGIRCGVGESGRRLAAILERERNMSAEFVKRRKEEQGRESLIPQTIRSGLGLPTVILMIFVAVIVTERLRALCQKNASIERKESWDQANLLLAKKRKIRSQAKPTRVEIPEASGDDERDEENDHRWSEQRDQVESCRGDARVELFRDRGEKSNMSTHFRGRHSISDDKRGSSVFS